jgi:hypothetical protein
MLPMWISPEGEIPLDTTTGRPDAIAASAATSAQCLTPSLLVVIVEISAGRKFAARYIDGVAIINTTVLS